MLVCFELSMPGVASWNGKWSGENDFYAVIESFRGKKAEKKAQEIIGRGYYHYSFGDGWRAAIHVRQVDAKEARSIRKRSKGFCGYEWMVESIILNGKIEV